MNKKSKLISGFKGSKIIQKPNKFFTTSEKHQIIQELNNSGSTKRDIWEKYTGQKVEHGQLLRWMRQLGYDSSVITRRPNFAENLSIMQKKQPCKNKEVNFENLRLKKRVAELEKQLKDAEMKAITFSTMVDIAEKEFNIPIKKKYNTKP